MRAERVANVVTSAIRRSGEWFLLLEFRPTPDEEADWSWLSANLLWLHEMGRGYATVCSDLRDHGMGLVAVSGEEEARRCFEGIEGFRVSATVFSSTGDRLPWVRPRQRSRRRRSSP